MVEDASTEIYISEIDQIKMDEFARDWLTPSKIDSSTAPVSWTLAHQPHAFLLQRHRRISRWPCSLDKPVLFEELEQANAFPEGFKVIMKRFLNSIWHEVAS